MLITIHELKIVIFVKVLKHINAYDWLENGEK